MRPEELLSIVDIDPHFPVNDMIDIGSFQSALEVDVSRVAGIVLQDDYFKLWLASNTPEVVLIEEIAASPRLGLYSATSVFSSMLATSIPAIVRSDQRPRFVTSFFCSIHSASDNVARGPKGMMRSIISQLIHSISSDELDRLNLAFIEGDPRLKDLLHRHDLNALCHIYATLICQLSRDVTIICILDEIGDFETDDLDWMNETCHVVQQLQRLTHHARNQGAIFKLYMSSSNRTSEIYKYLPEEARISPGSGIFGNAYITSATLMDDLVDVSREY
jgi:hypothetical protein